MNQTTLHHVTPTNAGNKLLQSVEIKDTGEYFLVSPIWCGVDRPNSGGYSTGKNLKLALRFMKFLQSGSAWSSEPEVCVDVNKQTYVNASLKISTRILNAELKRLSF